jgi:hypothetical protein
MLNIQFERLKAPNVRRAVKIWWWGERMLALGFLEKGT